MRPQVNEKAAFTLVGQGCDGHTMRMAATEKIEATVDGNALSLLAGGAERFDAILSLIAGAQTDLRLLFYMIADDPAGRAIRDALVEAADRGVAVKILVDGFGSGDIPSAFFRSLSDAGGHYCIFHPRYGRRYLIRNHQKLAIADGRLALIGGANLNTHYLEDESAEHWRDLWLQVDGPAIAELADYYDELESWTQQARPKIRDLRRIITHHSKSGSALAWRFGAPMRRHNPWSASVVGDILGAKRLDVIAAYFSPSGAMLRRIAGVVERGGSARIVTAARSDNDATIAAARHTFRRLLRRGVRVFEYQPAKLHTKLFVIDDVVHIGSANFDFRSIYLNLEMMLRIKDADFAKKMRAFLEREIDQSTEYTLASHRARTTWWRKLKWALSYFLVTSMDYTVTRRINFGLE